MLALFLANAVFAASELAFVSARRNRLELLANAGSNSARLALALAKNPANLLSTVQVGMTLISTVAAAFGGSTFVPYVAPALRPAFGEAAPVAAFVLVVTVITFVSLVVGELAPKRLALRNPEALALRVAPLMTWMSRATRAVVWLLNVSTVAVLKLIGANSKRDEAVTEEDVKALIDEAAEGGELEARETRLIYSAMKLTDRTARELMTPRMDVTMLDVTRGVPELLRDALDGGHARYPAHDGDPEHVLGLLTARDLLRLSLEPETPLRSLLRPLVFVPDTASSSSVLEAFRVRHARVALVVDEFGTLQGLITDNDLVGVLIEELADTPPGASSITRREDGSYLVDGITPLVEVRELLALPALSEEGFATLAGYVLRLLDHSPAPGESAGRGGWRLEILDMDGRRIDKVLVTPPAASFEPDPD